MVVADDLKIAPETLAPYLAYVRDQELYRAAAESRKRAAA
jgi:hypothetical protein